MKKVELTNKENAIIGSKILPHSVELEMCVLGSMIIDILSNFFKVSLILVLSFRVFFWLFSCGIFTIDIKYPMESIRCNRSFVICSEFLSVHMNISPYLKFIK